MVLNLIILYHGWVILHSPSLCLFLLLLGQLAGTFFSEDWKQQSHWIIQPSPCSFHFFLDRYCIFPDLLLISHSSMPLMSLTRFNHMRFIAFLMWFLLAWYSSPAICHLEKEVTTNTFPEPPGLLMLCSSNRYWGDWSSPWGAEHVTVRLLLYVSRGPNQLYLSGWVAYCKSPV